MRSYPKINIKKLKKYITYIYGLLFLFLALDLISYLLDKVLSIASNSIYFDFESQKNIINSPLGLFAILFYVIVLLLFLFTGLLSIIIFFNDIWAYSNKSSKNKIIALIAIGTIISTFLLLYLPFVPCEVKVISSGIVDAESSYNESVSIKEIIFSKELTLSACERKEIYVTNVNNSEISSHFYSI